jgi:hypothetical protein
MEFSTGTGKECSPVTFCEILLLHKFQTWQRNESSCDNYQAERIFINGHCAQTRFPSALYV